MSSESLRFDVDSTPAQLALKSVNKSLREIETQYIKLTKTTTTGSKETEVATQKLVAQYSKLSIKQQQLVQQTKQQVKEQSKLAGSMKMTNQTIGALAFGVDDFVTVFQMANDPIDGFVRGMRAAANNVSVVLMGIHPLLAIVPSLATAIGGPLVKSIAGANDELESMSGNLDTNMEKIRKFEAEIEKAGQKGEIRQGNAQLRIADQGVMAAGSELAGIEHQLEAKRNAPLPPIGGNINRQDPATRQKIREQQQNERDQEILILEGKWDAAKRRLNRLKGERQKVAAENQRIRGAVKAEERIGPAKGAIKEAVGALVAQGMDPAGAAKLIGLGLGIDDPGGLGVIAKLGEEAMGEQFKQKLGGLVQKIKVPANEEVKAAEAELKAHQDAQQDKKLQRGLRGGKLGANEREAQRQADAAAAIREKELKDKLEMLREQAKEQGDKGLQSVDQIVKLLMGVQGELQKFNRRAPGANGNG